MKGCWQNIYATCQPDKGPFYTKVKKGLDAISVADMPQVTTGHGTVVPAVAGGLLTDRRSDNVTMADGLGQSRDWQAPPSSQKHNGTTLVSRRI